VWGKKAQGAGHEKSHSGAKAQRQEFRDLVPGRVLKRHKAQDKR